MDEFVMRLDVCVPQPLPAASKICTHVSNGGGYDVVEISMISRGMTARVSSYDLWMISYMRAISRTGEISQPRYVSRCGDVAAAISRTAEMSRPRYQAEERGYLCCVLYVFIPLIYNFRNETSDIKGASHSTDSKPNTS